MIAFDQDARIGSKEFCGLGSSDELCERVEPRTGSWDIFPDGSKLDFDCQKAEKLSERCGPEVSFLSRYLASSS